jgi:hypothetical protein
MKAGIYKFRYDKYTIVPYFISYSGDNIIRLNADDVVWKDNSLSATNYTCIVWKGKLSNVVEVFNPAGTAFYIPNKPNTQFNSEVVGDLSELQNLPSSINIIKIEGKTNDLKGDINNIAASPFASTLTQLNLTSLGNYITGSIESLGVCTSLTNLSLYNLYNINGNVDNFAAAQVTAGRESGTLTLIVQQTKVTPNGTKTYTIKFGSSMVNPTEEETAQGYQIS